MLFDADAELTVCAQTPLSELFEGVVGLQDIPRAVSRLGELPAMLADQAFR